MLSSSYANIDQNAREQAGILRYLNKPVRRADLLSVVMGILNTDTGKLTVRRSAPDAHGRQLRGTVLLVEDNPINLSVAKAMLKKLGLNCQLASNGVEAVDRVRDFAFDLVLMDCQMPVMDGFEATSVIRQLPQRLGTRLPIVALTANTMQGDEQRCLSAGMDAFLGKPYSLQALRAVLSRWLRSADNDAEVVATHAIDPAVVDTLRELDESGGFDLARLIFKTFLESAAQGLDQVETAIVFGDGKALGHAAHALKSGSANVGAQTLSSAYGELERCGREGRIDDARVLLVSVRQTQDQALAQMRDMLTGFT